MKQLFVPKYVLWMLSIGLFAVSIAVKFLTGESMYISFTLITYGFSCFYILKYYQHVTKRWIYVLILFLPWMVFFLPQRLLFFQATLVSLPAFFGTPIGICIGFLLFYCPTPYRAFIAFLTMALCIWGSFAGYGLWLNYINYGSYNKNINSSVPRNLKIYDDTRKPYFLTHNVDGIKVLDFWNTSCAACFRKFPLVALKSKEYSNYSKIQFYAVNIPLKRDSSGQAQHAFEALRYPLNSLYAADDNVAKRFGVLTYPTIIVVYQNKIIYRGDIEGIDDILQPLIH